MHDIEPFYNWRHIYVSEEDERSPFYQREYSEFEFTQTVYNYYIHPQWDEFGSRTLYLKVLQADYDEHYVVIELLGEWNDAIENDIMTLKRDVIDKFEQEGIHKFILITENVMNFHSGDRDYYEEWYEEVNGEPGLLVIHPVIIPLFWHSLKALMTYGVVPLAAMPTTTSLLLISKFFRSIQPCSILSSAFSTALVIASSPPAITAITNP